MRRADREGERWLPSAALDCSRDAEQGQSCLQGVAEGGSEGRQRVC